MGPAVRPIVPANLPFLLSLVSLHNPDKSYENVSQSFVVIKKEKNDQTI
jgi:hypothetical protein